MSHQYAYKVEIHAKAMYAENASKPRRVVEPSLSAIFGGRHGLKNAVK